ncbi:MAG: glycosyltransferase [Candidatus Omnitrophota bacterium]
MKIGFYICWNKGSLEGSGNVLGDELFAESMCRFLGRIKTVKNCKVYAPNDLPSGKLDLMVYLNDTPPNPGWAGKHLLYIQNARPEGADKFLREFHKLGYDGYAFVSSRLLEIHKKTGRDGIYLPFGVDTEFFYPRQQDRSYVFEVAYVGNDIKGEQRTLRYLYPAVDFNFGLYGTWNSFRRFQFWKNRPYQAKFFRISKGKIPQNDVPVLYSSAKINLNCTAQDCVDWDVITLRTLEVLACGGFLITDKVPMAEKELSDCVVFTEGGADLTEKIKYYLANAVERKRVSGNGYEYVLKRASLKVRMDALYRYVDSIL